MHLCGNVLGFQGGEGLLLLCLRLVAPRHNLTLNRNVKAVGKALIRRHCGLANTKGRARAGTQNK
jgi:hypothetical protein